MVSDEQHPAATRRRIAVLCVFAAVLLAALAAAAFLPPGPLHAAKDEADIPIYLARSSWVERGGLPYRDEFVEYPAIGAYFLALPRIFTNAPARYAQLFYLFGALLLAGMFVLLWRTLPRARVHWALLLAAPGVVYYALNRYDALPAFLFLASVVSFVKRRETLAAVLFGFALGAKWYPLAALPLFVATAERRWRWLLVAGATALVVCAHPLVYTPFDKWWQTYSYHLARGSNLESIYGMLEQLLPKMAPWASAAVKHLLLALQLLPGLLAGWLAYRRRLRADDLGAFGALLFVSIGSFVLFAKFHSPQWDVWLAPLAALAMVRAVGVYFVVADTLKYLALPLAYHAFGWESKSLLLLALLYLVFLAYALAHAWRFAAAALRARAS